MQQTLRLMALLASTFLFLPAAYASEDLELDVTMRVVGPKDSLPDAVTKTIELPASASDTARENAAAGLEKANEARSRGREYGQSVSEQARAKAKKAK